MTAGRRVSRYGLWLLVWESGGDPDDLTRERAGLFLDQHLSPFLLEEGITLEPRERRQLEKRIRRFDPSHPTPEEWMTKTMDALAS